MDKLPKIDDAAREPSDPASLDTPDVARRRAITFLVAGAGLVATGLLAPRRAHAYGGRCYKCNCCSFEGSQNTCSNCGHSYENHSGQTC
jgi:hypothetical protein